MTTPTKRLYYKDSELMSFYGQVVQITVTKMKPSIVLDKTAFYPESGGQMADHGQLAGLRVTDVVVDEDGTIHHIVEAEQKDLPDIGKRVFGKIDRFRRRIHMAHHTGQHMLSSALLKVANAQTVSAHLGESSCTIDVDHQNITPNKLQEVQDMVNSAIDADYPIKAYFPTADELAQMPLRRPSKVEQNIRVITISNFDLVPCGGTHCTHTSQVHLVKILNAERYKGMTRVTFAAGPKARELLSHSFNLLNQIGQNLCCSQNNILQTIHKIRQEFDGCKEMLGRLRTRLAQNEVKTLLEKSTTNLVVGSFDDVDTDFLRIVGKKLIASGEKVALLAAPSQGGTAIVVARGKKSCFNCGAFVKAVAHTTQGRGGGGEDHAAGRLPSGIDWKVLVDQHQHFGW